MPGSEDALTRFASAWVSWVASLSPEELRASGKPPWANISHGAAGNAYALWHIATRRGDQEILERARRWTLLAMKLSKRPDGLPAAGRRIGGSVWFGMPGLHVVTALVEHGLGRIVERDRALSDFMSAAPRIRTVEAAGGLAGLLTSTLLLHRHTREARLVRHGDALVDRIRVQLARQAGRPGFAHGTVGVHHALFTWAKATQSPVATELEHAAGWSSAEARAAAQPRFAWSQCNGLAGYIQLWVAAYEKTGDPYWFRTACAAAAELRQSDAFHSGNFCCGVTGHAYALLAVARIDPGGPDRQAAFELARRALADEGLGHGLLSGLGGVACLATDLGTTGPIVTPLVGG